MRVNLIPSNKLNLRPYQAHLGGNRWLSWLRHCATSRKVVGSIPSGDIWNFSLINSFRKIKGEMEVTKDEEEDVRNYWMTLRTGEDTLI